MDRDVGAVVQLASKSENLRLCFFITSYRAPEQLIRLVEVLRRSEPEASIVIYRDHPAHHVDPPLFESDPHVHVLRNEPPIRWGDLSLDRVRWRVFRWILANLDVDWVVLLSEQDYPIKPLNALRARLAEGSDAFIEGQQIGQIDQEDLRRNCETRYLYQYAVLPEWKIGTNLPARWKERWHAILDAVVYRGNLLQPWIHVALMPRELQLPNRIGLRAKKSPFGPSFPCWYHDAWFAMSRKAIQVVIDYIDTHPDLLKYYERTVIPLESVTGTIVFNSPELNVDADGVHETRWSNASSGRPDVYALADLEYLRSSSAAFARKFDITESELLDQLDRMVLAEARGPSTSDARLA